MTVSLPQGILAGKLQPKAPLEQNINALTSVMSILYRALGFLPLPHTGSSERYTKPGDASEWHTHDRFGRALRVVNGACRLETERQIIDLNYSDWAYIPAGVRHRFVATAPGLVLVVMYAQHRSAFSPR